MFSSFTRTSFTRHAACGAATLAALALAAPASAQARTTISFDNFAAQAEPTGGYGVGPSYDTQGFTFTNVSGSQFTAYAADSDEGDGEIGLSSGFAGDTVKLTQDNGQAFSLDAIDIGPFFANTYGALPANDAGVVFIGTKTDGTTVTVTKLDTLSHYQTFDFTGLTDLTKLEFGPQNLNAVQEPLFDKVVLTPTASPAAVPEPSASASFAVGGLGLLGLLLLAKKKKAAASA